MSALLNTAINSVIPLGYVTPPFPSLYWPIPVTATHGYYLYHTADVWRFTLYWTLLFYAALHVAASGYAVAVQWRSWKVIWIAPVLFALIGGLEAVIAGSVVGGLLGSLYQAGAFRMSTWVPFVWALINSLIIILSSFAIQGGL